MPYWFKPKRFWKWFACYYPASRRGWAVTFMLLGIGGLIFSFVDSRSHSVSDTAIAFAPWAIILLMIFDILCLCRGEYPSWWKKQISSRQPIRTRFVALKKLIDPWSVPHFLFGMVMALIAIVFFLPVFYSFLATLYLAIFWELLEKRYRLSEAPGNAVTDILLSLFAFGITFFLVDRTDPNPEHHSALLIVVSLLYISTNFFAWRARFERDREFLG